MIESMAARILAALASTTLLVGLGGWIGFKVSESHHLNKITKLEGEVTKLKADKAVADDDAARKAKYCDALDAATAKQDEQIAELARQAEAQRVASEAAAAAARSESERLQAEAAKVGSSRAPAGVDACVSARNAFDEELRAERAGRAK